MGSSESKPEEVGQNNPSNSSIQSFNFISGIAPFPSFGGPAVQKETQEITVISIPQHKEQNTIPGKDLPVDGLSTYGKQDNPSDRQKNDQVDALDVPNGR
jgi:hypothetical protein